MEHFFLIYLAGLKGTTRQRFSFNVKKLKKRDILLCCGLANLTPSSTRRKSIS